MEKKANFLSVIGTITFETFRDTAIAFCNNQVDWETLNQVNWGLYADLKRMIGRIRFSD